MTTLYDNIFEIQVLMSNIFDQYNKELMGNKQGIKLADKIIENNVLSLNANNYITVENIQLNSEQYNNQNCKQNNSSNSNSNQNSMNKNSN